MSKKKLTVEDIDLFIFDFDGVLTDNFVYLDQNGLESVRCSRADGLAFDVLRKLHKPAYILSTETNPVVSLRANKLVIPVIQGVKDKKESTIILARDQGYNLSNIMYIGNDLNDYNVMQICGYKVCPSDSHPKIKDIADFVLNTNGGKGVVREVLEDILGLDFVEILYKK